MLCGPSSGINVVAAHKVAAAHPELRRIVTVDPRHRAALPVAASCSASDAEVEEPERDHTIDARHARASRRASRPARVHRLTRASPD